MKNKYIYWIKNNEYNCNRMRQAEFLLAEGVKPIRVYFDNIPRCHWVFKGDEVIDLLNKFCSINNIEDVEYRIA